jgi:hypothetical protein
MATRERWEVRLYETSQGRTPVLDFMRDLPARHQAKVRQVIERLELFGPRLGFPDSSAVKGTSFRELRTRFAGQQYRVLYIQDGRRFVLFVGFHKTSDRDLDRAIREAEKHLTDYRSQQS